MDDCSLKFSNNKVNYNQANLNVDDINWVQRLGSTGRDQQSALSDLREILIRTLRKSLAGRSSVDESFLEDAVQDALMLILDKLEQFEGRSQFITWATSIAIHVSMSKLRRKQWQEVSLDQMITDSSFSFEEVTDDTPGFDMELQRNDILKEMHTVIQEQLTEKQRIALLSELKGMPQDLIAQHLGSSRNALYKLTHDARKRLKQGLESAGYSAADVNVVFTV